MDISTAGPLVLDVLSKACSQNADVLKPAELQLKQWETQSGFYSILLSIFSNHNIDVNVRWLAVLYFKNGVDRYWRKNAPNAISEEEKLVLREKLISNFNEPVSQVATQMAVLIAKVARVDCPKNWTQLIPTLLEGVRTNDQLLQQRALLTLHHVTKTLASKRLAPDRKVFEELTNNIFSFVLNLWNHHTEHFVHLLMSGAQDQTSIAIPMDHGLLALKVLRKMMVFGFRDPDQVDDTMLFIKLIFERLKTVLECKNAIAMMPELLPRREKLIVLLTKVLLDVQEIHADCYIQFIQPSLDMAVTYNFTEAGSNLLFERFTVNCFNLIRSIIRCENYRPAKAIEETQNPLCLEAYRIKSAFFNYTTLSEICRRLVSQYFLLTEEDLQCWDSDPEEYISDEGGDSWKFSLRPCTENLYLTLFKEYREALTPVVLEMVKQVQVSPNPDDLTSLLSKDAVYNAVGLSSFDLYDEIDFDKWFTSHLLAELQMKHPNYRIIRRRVIWLIGCWVGVKMSVDLRPTLYEAILPLLGNSEDLVVRIEAAIALKVAVDDFEFRTEQFLPYLESSFALLFQLLKEVEECETKMQVLHVMSFVIERVGMKIRPYAAALIQYLPMLWEESADHNMLRCAILTTLVHLVQGLGPLCGNMYDFLLPVIQLSTDVCQEPHVYLLEDGLELWKVTLHNSPHITTQLLQLYSNIPTLLELGSENLRICLKIIESYVLLGSKQFMQHCGNSLVFSLSTMVTDIRTEGLVLVMKLIELVFRAFPTDGPELFMQMLPNIFKSTLEGEEYPMVMAVYLSLIGRIILQHQQFFWTFLDDMSTATGQASGDLIGALLDVWVDRVDNITQPERRKLSALSMASLLNVNISAVVDRFSSIINVCVEILHDVCRLEGGCQVDSLLMTDDSHHGNMPEDEMDTEHDKRKREFSRQDPIHVISLKDYVTSQLNQCQQLYGAHQFDQLMSTVDPEIYTQLQHFLQ